MMKRSRQQGMEKRGMMKKLKQKSTEKKGMRTRKPKYKSWEKGSKKQTGWNSESNLKCQRKIRKESYPYSDRPHPFGWKIYSIWRYEGSRHQISILSRNICKSKQNNYCKLCPAKNTSNRGLSSV